MNLTVKIILVFFTLFYELRNQIRTFRNMSHFHIKTMCFIFKNNLGCFRTITFLHFLSLNHKLIQQLLIVKSICL